MTSLFDDDLLNNRKTNGEDRRDSALGLLRVQRAALIHKLTAATLRFVLAGGEVCADDVRGNVEMLAGISTKCVGVVFRDLADAGILRRTGYRTSARPIELARSLSVWALDNRDAAVAQLAELDTLIATAESSTNV